MHSRSSPVPALLLLVAFACACDSPARPEVVVERRVDALRLEVAPVQADPSCAPVPIPVCVTNHTASSRSVGPLALEGPVAASVEGDLAQAAGLAPGEQRCGQVLLQPLGRIEVVVGVRAPVEGRGTLRGRLRVPPCGAGPLAATLDVPSRLEVTRACEARFVPACVRPLTGVAVEVVEVVDARIEGSTAWRIAERPDLPARATASEPVCFELEAASLGRGSHAGRLEVDVAGLDVPLERDLLLNDALDYHQVDTFMQLKRPAADFLFVVDDDPAIDGAALPDNLKSWAAFAQQVDFDFRAAVTTTDPFFAGRLLVGPGGGPAVLTADDPLFAERLSERAQLVRAPDTPNRGFEAGLAAARRMDQRLDAYLAVVFVSPTDDVSPGGVEAHADLYVSLRGYRNRALVMTGAIVGDVAGGCLLPGGGQAAPGPRYVELSRATGGVADSICDANWAAALSSAARVPYAKTRFFLTTAAAPGSIEVHMIDPDGGERIEPPDHWTYDADANAVDFNPFHVPDAGEIIEIRYRRDCRVESWLGGG